MATWFVNLGGTELGPVNDAQLRELAASGKLAPDDLVRKEGMDQKVQAGKIRGLFAGAAMPPPLPVAGPQSPSLATDYAIFSAWYEDHVGSWAKPLQVLAWVFYGFLWIPGWWAFTLLNGSDPAMQSKGKRVATAVAAGLVIFVTLAIFGNKNRPPRSNASARMPASSFDASGLNNAPVEFMEFRKRLMGRSFDESSFFEQFGRPAKILSMPELPAGNKFQGVFQDMYPADLVHGVYKCKDENAIVQYRQENGSIEVIAVIKAADFMVAPPSLWKHTHYD